jgi:hypothetical protein
LPAIEQAISGAARSGTVKEPLLADPLRRCERWRVMRLTGMITGRTVTLEYQYLKNKRPDQRFPGFPSGSDDASR